MTLDLDSHVNDQRVADARWMASDDGGRQHPDVIAKRLGITRDTLDKMLSPSRQGARTP